MSRQIFNWMSRNGRTFFILTVVFALGHQLGRYQMAEQAQAKAAVSDAAYKTQMTIRAK